MNIAVLGSTGSIGTQALDVIASLGYAATGLSAGKNIELLSEQIAAFQPQIEMCIRDSCPTHSKDEACRHAS